MMVGRGAARSVLQGGSVVRAPLGAGTRQQSYASRHLFTYYFSYTCGAHTHTHTVLYCFAAPALFWRPAVILVHFPNAHSLLLASPLAFPQLRLPFCPLPFSAPQRPCLSVGGEKGSIAGFPTSLCAPSCARHPESTNTHTAAGTRLTVLLTHTFLLAARKLFRPLPPPLLCLLARQRALLWVYRIFRQEDTKWSHTHHVDTTCTCARKFGKCEALPALMDGANTKTAACLQSGETAPPGFPTTCELSVGALCLHYYPF